MPYIGNDLATQFQAFATQTITGDGSTSYTLDRAVANGKELLVYINNVKQEEGSGKAYEASGTTITFSEAVASGDSCYLVYMGSAQQTVTAPAGSIVSSQFSSSDIGITGSLGVGTTSPSKKLNVSTSTTYDGILLSNSHASSAARLQLNNNDSKSLQIDIGGSTQSTYGPYVANTAAIVANSAPLNIGTDSSNQVSFYTALTERMKIDANGHVTMPSQSAFFAHADAMQNNIAANSTQDITFGTERFDQNNDFASNTFTAPVTGKYQLNVNIRLNNLDTAAAYYIIYLVTTNKNYFSIIAPDQFAADVGYFCLNFGVIADMDAGDTAKVRYLQSGGSAQTDVDGGSGDTASNFSGFLVA